jgi:hypothetical protein
MLVSALGSAAGKEAATQGLLLLPDAAAKWFPVAQIVEMKVSRHPLAGRRFGPLPDRSEVPP